MGGGAGGGDSSQDQKKVTVQVGEKYKGTGQSSKKRIPSANLDLPRSFLTCKEEGAVRLDLSKSGVSALPPSVRDLTHLTELYLYRCWSKYLPVTHCTVQ